MKKILIISLVLFLVFSLFVFINIYNNDEVNQLQLTLYEKTFIEDLFQVTLSDDIMVTQKELDIDFKGHAVVRLKNQEEFDSQPEEVIREIRDYSCLTIELEIVVDQNRVDDFLSSYSNEEKWFDHESSSLPEEIGWKPQNIDYYSFKEGFATKNIVLSNGDVYELKTVRDRFLVVSKSRKGKVTVFMYTYFTEHDYSKLEFD